jgi:hypothetical protein
MCELCDLKVIEEEYYRNTDFVIISCMNCHVPMVVPFEHVDPKANGYERLRERMENELFKAAFEFYGNLNFYIDKKENKILDHMHWHARSK